VGADIDDEVGLIGEAKEEACLTALFP